MRWLREWAEEDTLAFCLAVAVAVACVLLAWQWVVEQLERLGRWMEDSWRK